ncbi:MAG: amino acid adenylation domain-containing protein [Clostridia bacterium]|nr:amino acid adenylation domain-containing protein [Clostridia bacterium]
MKKDRISGSDKETSSAVKSNKSVGKNGLIPDICPLSASQLGVYLECVNKPGTIKYNIPVLCRLPAGTDRVRFIDAVKTVIGAHPALFVTVSAPDGVPSMIYHGSSDSFGRKIFIEEKESDSIDAEAAVFPRPFDLEEGPLCRFEYVITPEGDAFLLDIHHLIFDGTSLSLFIRQIASVYDGGECRPETLTIFDNAQAESLPKDPQKTKEYADFFREKLGASDCDSKPVRDRVSDEVPHGFSSVSVRVNDRISFDEVENYIKANRISENALFLGAFGYTLAKFNGMTESFFTTAHTGRLDPELALTVGMYVRTLPFICSFDEKNAPSVFLRNVYNDYYRIKKNDCISFADLAAEYGIGMNVSFVYQANLLNDISISDGNIPIELLLSTNGVADFELMFLKTASGYSILSYFNRSDYSEEFVRSFIDTYINVVHGMIYSDTLGEIPLTDEKSRAQIDGFNRTEKEYDTEKTVVDLFREQAKKTPDAECLVFCEKRFTYSYIDGITDRLAGHLRSLGIGKGHIVGVLIPRCEYMLICSLGVLKAGAAYLPLDPSYPPERLNLMMKDSEASLLLTTPDLDSIINGDFVGKRIMVDSIPTLEDSGTVLPAPKKDDLFIMLYTSGSTGTPKGVMYAHSNTMVTAAWIRDYYSLGEGCCVTAYASYGFDANVFDTYATITSGAALHIISDDIRLDLIALQKYFNENNITHSVMTTQVGRQFALLEGTKTLRHLSFGGEKLTPLTPPENISIYNLYGPTEGSVLATAFRVDRLYKDVPIGKPVDNVKLYVVDSEGRLLPPGAVGELWITGAHVTVGYRNRPEKTAEVFVTNPFSNDAGYERAYRTGDIVRLMCDGNLQFIGRRDGQVKVRGFRVELTEIEEVIRRFHGIKDATVAAFDEPSGGKFIAAYVVSDEIIDTDALADFIRSEKPPYMVPAVTMQIDRIPLNQNQKVNKKALPRPERKADCSVPPENDTQQKIFDIIADVIGHREFGIDTDIFDAGLTSIGTLKLNVILGKSFDTAVRIVDLKRSGTVRKLESFLSFHQKTDENEIMPDYPITQTQRGIFVECSMNPGSVTYNIPLLLKLGKGIDPERLVSAVKTAINAHPYAKATFFADDNGDIRARRNDADEPKVDLITCAEIPSRDELVRPFNLLGEPLFRAAVYVTDNGNYLFTDFHHIIFDGTSEAVLLSDIGKAYELTSVENEKYTGYEIALDEEKERATDRLSRAKAYYDSVFLGCESDCLPPKSPESDKAGAASVRMTFDYAPAVTAYCEKNKLTPNAFFNAAFGFTLSRFIQFSDVVFTTVYNGRNDSRLASSLAMLVKTLPVLVRTENDIKISDLIRETQEQLMNSMSNDICSFAEISRYYGIKSDLIFVYQGDSFTFDTLCGEPAEFVDIQPEVAKAPITVNVYLRGGKYEFEADYRRDIYCAEFIENLLSALACAVREFTVRENIREISLLSDESKEKLRRINDTKREFENISVNRLFELRAAEHPDKTAVIGNGKNLTYGELDRAANKIANALSSLGIGKDTVVAMVLDRTVEISVTEIGILKSGGAFLGMLPSYPDDRISFCLDDAKCPAVITTEEIRAAKPELFSLDKPYRTLTIEKILADGDDSDPGINIPTDSLAYCIYTSGSTGKPKGVMIEHHNLVCCADPTDFTYSLYHGKNGGDVGLALSSISFDMSIFDNLLLLMNGKTVCIATEQEIYNPGMLADLLMKNHVDMIATTPSFVTNYLGIPEFRPALANLKATPHNSRLTP